MSIHSVYNSDNAKVISGKSSLIKKASFWIARKVIIKKSRFWSKVAQLFFSRSKNFQEIARNIQEGQKASPIAESNVTIRKVENSSIQKTLSDVQTPWTKTTEAGFTVFNGELETTEGFGAYMDFCLRPGTRNFDNGGGSHNYNSLFLKKYVGVANVVYDPFQRSAEENRKALEELEKHDFDTATSNSVLNVIDTREARLEHIKLSCKALKEGGVAYFKVYSGDKTGIGKHTPYGFLSNRLAESYQTEVEEIFGRGNVVTCRESNMLIAYKNSGCKEKSKV